MKKVLIATGIAALAFASVASAAFDVNLTVGSTGADVASLQTLLIAKGFSIPAIQSGAATPGYFGSQTKTAVMAYQSANGIPNTGFVGPLTRAALNAGGGVAGGVPTVPGVIVCPIGYNCFPQSGGTTPPTSGGSSEGQLENFGTLGDVESEVEEGDTDAKVLGIEFDADDSDMTISRVDVDLQETSAADNSERINRYFDSVSLWLDGQMIAEMDVDEASEDDDVYSFRFTGLNEVVGDGDTAELYVAVTSLDSIDGNDEDASWTVTIPSDGIRAVDTAGISDTYGLSGDAEEVFDISGLSGVELKVTRSSSDGDDRSVEANDTNTTNNVTLLTFRLAAEDSDIAVDEIPVTISTTSDSTVGVNIGEIARRFTLWKGSQLLDSVNATSSDVAATIIFSDLENDLELEEGDTVELIVKADILDLDGTTFFNGDGLKASLTAGNVAGIEAEDSMGDALTGSELSGSATGKDVVFFTDGIAVDLVGITTSVGKSADAAVDDVVTFIMKFDVTAFGETAYIASTTASTTDESAGIEWSVIGDTFTGLGNSNLTSTADETDDDNAFEVAEGDTETFTLTVVLNNAAGTAGFYGVQVNRIQFNDEDSAAIADYTALTTGLDELETDEIPLN